MVLVMATECRARRNRTGGGQPCPVARAHTRPHELQHEQQQLARRRQDAVLSCGLQSATPLLHLRKAEEEAGRVPLL